MMEQHQQEHRQAEVARRALAEGDRAYEEAARAMRAMADDGLTQRRIAEQVGCSQARVSRLLRALDSRANQDVPFADAYAAVNDADRRDDPVADAIEASVPGARVRPGPVTNDAGWRTEFNQWLKDQGEEPLARWRAGPGLKFNEFVWRDVHKMQRLVGENVENPEFRHFVVQNWTKFHDLVVALERIVREESGQERLLDS